MSKKLFRNDDIFINRIKTHPELDFFIYNSEVFLNNNPNISGSNSDTYRNVPAGNISLLELNINRSDNLIYPFVQDGFNEEFKTVLHGNFGSQTQGSAINYTSSYPLSASIYRSLTTTETLKDNRGQDIDINKKGSVLYNLGKKYAVLSKRFTISHLTASQLNLINIPSIFYGSSIKKGTATLKYYITGTLIASAIDERQNGELISDFGNSSGSVVGLIYYDEGVIALPKQTGPDDPLFVTGSSFTSSYFWSGSLDTYSKTVYDGGGTPFQPALWGWFGAGANDGISHHATMISASFSINFKGTSYKNTMTLMCHADKGEMNWSNNPTFLDQSSDLYNKQTTGSAQYYELESPIKNVVSSSYTGHSASFAKTTYITKVGIYDENDNLIMTAEMARPYKKEEEKDITFKLKYDLI